MIEHLLLSRPIADIAATAQALAGCLDPQAGTTLTVNMPPRSSSQSLEQKLAATATRAASVVAAAVAAGEQILPL